MIDEIKQIVKNMIDNMKLTDYVYGEVTNINPLSIKIDQKLTISSDVILLTYPVIEKKINLQHTHQYMDGDLQRTTGTELPNYSEAVIVEGLAEGDKVLMLRVDRGQKFIVLSKAV